MSEVKKVDTTNELTKFDNFSNLNEMKDFAQELIKSNLIPFKTAEQAVAVAMLGRDLGIGFSTAMNNIYNINGKPSLSVHLAAALVKRTGVDWQIEKDNEAVLNKEGKVADYITSIRFFRFNKQLDRVIENVISFTWRDAVAAGYANKDNWQTKRKNMLRARCLMEGFRFVAPDALMGVFYETSELLDTTTSLNYEIDDNNNVTVIKDKNGKIIK